jgi:NADP-dependent 3-hydroxy-3-methylglutaryl-CoA reductase
VESREDVMSLASPSPPRRITVDADAQVDLVFVLGSETIRSRVLDLGEDGLRVAYPASARDLAAGQWLASVAIEQPNAPAVQLRVLTVASVDAGPDGCRTLHLTATDARARAGLWLAMDSLLAGPVAPTAAALDVRIRAIPQRGIYTEQARLERLAYIRARTGVPLATLERTDLRADRLAGNIENLIGAVEVPVGLAGPLLFHGEHVRGRLFAPMATTEGALVASATRGAIALTRAGGVTTRVVRRTMVRVPVFVFSDMRGASRFANWVRDHVDDLRDQAARVSRHARLIDADPELRGNMVTVTFRYDTGDAAGQNMTTSCTWHACQWLMHQMSYLDEIRLDDFFIESGLSGDKKVSFQSLVAGRGARVTAECVLPRQVAEEVLKVTPDDLVRGFHLASAFGTQSGTVGWNINVANVIAAMFTATGQDIACVHESSVALLYLQNAPEGVYASLVLPSLVVGTVGGGTHLPRQTDLLELIGCAGPEKVSRFAEIIAGFCLALDLSTLAAIAGGQFVAAHERLGRNRPVRWFTRNDLTPAFFEPGIRRLLDDETAGVERVELQTVDDTGGSILTQLTAGKVEKLLGFVRARLVLAGGRDGRRSVDTLVKVKPLDEEVILMTHRLAAMCGGGLAASHARFKDRLGLRHCHVRELEMYAQTDDRFRRHMPDVVHTFRDDAREAFVVVLEDLAGLELLDSANDPDRWQAAHLEAAIDGLAAMQAVWFDRERELAALPWLEMATPAGFMADMQTLWSDLSVHAAREFPEWFTDGDLALRQALIGTMPEWCARADALPRTLTHNDFNPRNLAFRRTAAELRLVAYDWELAGIGLPQHDLAELLCYVLPVDADSADVDRWIDRHRAALARETGVDLPAAAWREGFRVSLFDLAVNRLMLTTAAHTFRHFPFMERIHATLRQLLAMELAREPLR